MKQLVYNSITRHVRVKCDEVQAQQRFLETVAKQLGKDAFLRDSVTEQIVLSETIEKDSWENTLSVLAWDTWDVKVDGESFSDPRLESINKHIMKIRVMPYFHFDKVVEWRRKLEDMGYNSEFEIEDNVATFTWRGVPLLKGDTNIIAGYLGQQDVIIEPDANEALDNGIDLQGMKAF